MADVDSMMADYYRLSRFAGGPVWNCLADIAHYYDCMQRNPCIFIATYCVGYPDKCTTEYRLK